MATRNDRTLAPRLQIASSLALVLAYSYLASGARAAAAAAAGPARSTTA